MADLSRADLHALDARDPLAGFRDAFHLPEGVVYLDGNSLGALPKTTRSHLAEVIDRQWGVDLIRSWNTHGWIEAPRRVGAKIAALIGAAADEVVVADSTSVNLYKLVCGALALRPDRSVILAEPGNFPTDLHILQGIVAASGGRLTLKTPPREGLAAALDESVAVVVLTHVHYKTAERWPMGEITRIAHDHGALALWDLSHSAGALAVNLNACEADLAVGCGYKYFNGGPGAPGFAFVAQRHQARLVSPIWGWMGHAAPFAFGDAYQAASGITGQLVGTPPMLSLSALESGLEIFAGVDMATLEAKAHALAETLITLVETRCDGLGLTLASPRDPTRRGCHVSFAHPDGYAIMQALIARGVIGDFRSPDILRFGLTPLYVRFVDIWDAVEALRDVLESGVYRQERFQVRLAVT
jgi:kynureninase